MNQSNHPKFAVVGHPNKGKSSIVASLALDDSVQIANTPGTTQVNRGFPLVVDGKVVYELFDTPGFQRARRILAWLQSQEPVSADKRADLIKAFVAHHREDKRFHDEIELLEPIINGAGIIYVVDASKPYGAEYETEMEILRYTAQPSMAILNLIGKEDYRDQWKRALGQYFRMVRTYNPMTATFEDHIALLESMAQLKEEWTKDIKRAISVLSDLYKQKIDQSASAIVKYIQKSLSYQETLIIQGERATQSEDELAKANYQSKLIRYEKELEKEIESIWNHRSIEKIENILAFDGIGLFSEESASIFGLSKKELMITGASAGALGGLGIDVALGGSSLFLASLLGGAVGGVGAMLGFDNIYNTKIIGQTFGRRELRIGPMKNLNFPYILLGRSLYYTSILAKRSHALRDTLQLENDTFYTQELFDSDKRKELEKMHTKLRKGEEVSDEILQEYKKSIKESLTLIVER